MGIKLSELHSEGRFLFGRIFRNPARLMHCLATSSCNARGMVSSQLLVLSEKVTAFSGLVYPVWDVPTKITQHEEVVAWNTGDWASVILCLRKGSTSAYLATSTMARGSERSRGGGIHVTCDFLLLGNVVVVGFSCCPAVYVSRINNMLCRVLWT